MSGPDYLANAIWKHLEPKMNAQTLTDPQVEEHKKFMTTKLEELMTTELEEHTKLMTTKLEEKFEEHTKLMNAKFEKQQRRMKWIIVMLFFLHVISALADLGLTWIMKMMIDESSSSRWDMNSEAPPNSRVFCQYVKMTKGDGTIIWDGIVSAWNYTQHLYNVTRQ